MALSVHRFCFQWHIYNPFLPRRSLEAAFFYDSPEAKQWKVTVELVDSRINFRVFSVSLQLLDPSHEVVASSVQLFIDLNGAALTSVSRLSRFRSANEFKYYFEGSDAVHPQMEPNRLVIRFEISLPERAAGNYMFSDESYLCRLSEDLKLLLREPHYPNMTLYSKDRHQSFSVHSYILDARWNNFSEKHKVNANVQRNIEVETNISHELLREILNYMYSGELGEYWQNWENAAYCTELFQVIDSYKLTHLYEAFKKNDCQQMRVTRHPTLIESRLLPLDKFSGGAVNKASHTWLVNSNPEYKIVFKIRLWDDAGNWLSYSLQSNSPSRVYARVNLELVKREEGDAEEKDLPFHEQVYTIDPEATVESRSVLFLGCPETFSALEPTSSDGAGTKFFVRCFLKVTNGTKVDHVETLSTDTLRNDLDLLTVLSDHMKLLRERRFHAEMKILSSSFFHNDVVIEDCIHKAILATRVPEWWDGLENASRQDGIPDTATATLSSETLPFVLNYIYTGKVSSIPFPFIHEVAEFARKTVFGSLHDIAISLI